ncbi:MAG: ISL3 family transposase [Candidatus Aegiribacteria sp.]|nr:ISL3 family transposase [Candidatus Aegiribacteria sp.]
MPHDSIILSLSGYRIERVHGGNPVYLDVVYTGEVTCPFCKGGNLRNKGRYIRKLRHDNYGSRPCYLNLEGRKYYCRDCGRYFNQRFPGILPYYRSTEVYRRYVFQNHHDGICSKTLAERERIGSATVERWYHSFLERKVSERSNSLCPEVLGIDEHFFTRKQGYATTFCDLGGKRVFDITLGRSERSLEGYLSNLKGRDRVKMVCIDLSTTYRKIVRKYFPNADIVADRFHVIRLINNHFLNTWRSIDPEAAWNRGLLSLMRRHKKNLRPEQRERLYKYLDQHPVIRAIYFFKQDLCRILLKKTCCPKTCRQMIPKLMHMIEDLKESDFRNLRTLGNTLGEWIDEIVRMWRYTRNNGVTEGFHNKMKMIVRRAFGFRNFANYRLRVRALCA